VPERTKKSGVSHAALGREFIKSRGWAVKDVRPLDWRTDNARFKQPMGDFIISQHQNRVNDVPDMIFNDANTASGGDLERPQYTVNQMVHDVAPFSVFRPSYRSPIQTRSRSRVNRGYGGQGILDDYFEIAGEERVNTNPDQGPLTRYFDL